MADVKKPFSGKVIELSGLCLSFRSAGKGSTKKIPCVRQIGSGARIDHSKAPLILVSKALKAKNAKIFMWKRRSGRMYYLAGANAGQVEKWVKDTEKKRIRKYRGLAKHALGRLMNKVANSSGINDNVAAASQTIAEKNTNVTKQMTGYSNGIFSMTLADELRYAIDALQGGYAEIWNCMKKAMNAITKVVEKRIGAPLDHDPKDRFPS